MATRWTTTATCMSPVLPESRRRGASATEGYRHPGRADGPETQGIPGGAPIRPERRVSGASGLLRIYLRYQHAGRRCTLRGGHPPGRLVEIPGNWVLDDANHVMYSRVPGRTSPLKTPSELYDIWASEFEGLYRYGRAFTLTMHPQHVGRPGRLLMLERLINHIHSFPNVAFKRMIDVAEMWGGGRAPELLTEPLPDATFN